MMKMKFSEVPGKINLSLVRSVVYAVYARMAWNMYQI